MSRHIRNAKRRHKKKKKLLTLSALFFALALIVFLLIYLFCKLTSQSTTKSQSSEASSSLTIGAEDTSTEEATATLLATGDIIMHKPFLTSSTYLSSDGSYDYTSIFKYVQEDFEAADFVTTTIEGSLTDGNFTGYPNFRTPPALATALKAVGVDMTLLANNHIYDNGDDGLQSTIQYVTENDLLYTGIRQNTDEKPYQIQDINGIKVGMINYVYETPTSTASKAINAIPVSDASAPLINSFYSGDLDSFYTEIDGYLKEMREAGAEFTIAYMHWGVEYDTSGTDEQRQMAQKLCDLGLDALIGSHPHVIQPVDVLTSADGENEMLVAYAIGNQVSNQRTEYMDGLTYGYSEDGYMVRLTLHRSTDGAVTIDNAGFIPIWLYHSTNGGGEYYILPLDEPDTLASTTGLSLGSDVTDSLDRTNGIIANGVEKVQSLLPLK